jgi:AcrR family transcriptional regulator
MASHLSAEQRTTDILAAALRVAERDGYTNLRRDAIAAEAGVTGGLVTIRLGSMTEIRRDVMRHAVKNCILRIVAEGLAIKDRHALKAGPELRAQAAAWLAAR